jgi:hypothetical protein
MAKRLSLVPSKPTSVLIASIEKRIYIVRGQKVMLDTDLAQLYRVPTFRLNEQVKRNRRRFPRDFMFRLNPEEAACLTSQNAMSNVRRGGRRTLPYAFTEQGVAMLSSVLNSDRAVQVNIAVMRAFVRVRQIIAANKDLARKIDELEKKYLDHDSQLETVFQAIRELIATPAPPPKRRIGFATEPVGPARDMRLERRRLLYP